MIEKQTISRELAMAFSTTARCACFRQAARSLNVHTTALRKQIKQLDNEVGEPLFYLQDRSLRLTLAGESLFQELARKFGDLRPSTPQISEPLRIAAPESLMHDVLARNLIAFIRRNGALRVELSPLDGPNIEQADVMIWLAEQGSRRPDPGFAMTKPHLLGTINYYPHIATRYSSDTRHPSDISALDDYMLVQQQINYPVDAFTPWNNLVDQRKNSVTLAHKNELVRELIKNSSCIGLLPEYVSNLDKKLHPLKNIFDKKMQRSAWIATTPISSKRDEVQSAVKLVLNAFSERHEWFE
ncbi:MULTISPECIES: LysR family transcriptional regulator [unclassified Pseudomonas]|uniref:LysR family transcriptional regulator n=1 Tax=unclassified Pseudomonas TaxID=196821 RepID=UPI00244D1E77|nr:MULTISPECIES: LysR family transcriptional regulator [unclassified Pseudomonas]MDG9928028.1 LysR family transcriptional regulator [Pseudomonas sp. GD04042]MDH0482037.1 LysR family transcriptional regulator [Pseudomonas sp. GD04015]MDH0604068.1 LysR family transcriptional regulator [Pseudomonas sp. GD03869]